MEADPGSTMCSAIHIHADETLEVKKKKKKNHLNLNPALTCTPEEEQKDIFKDNDREDDHK